MTGLHLHEARAIPGHCRRETGFETRLRREAQRANLRDVRATPKRAAGTDGTRDDLDLSAEACRDAVSNLGHGHFIWCADVINVQMSATFDHTQEAVRKIIDIDEGTRLASSP